MDEKIIIKYNKEFVKGNQNIDINSYNVISKTFSEMPPQFYWQSHEVFNIIGTVPQFIKSSFPDKAFSEKDMYGKGSLINILVPYQKAYNDCMNKQIECLNRLHNPNLIVPEVTGVPPEAPVFKLDAGLEYYNILKEYTENIKEEIKEQINKYIFNLQLEENHQYATAAKTRLMEEEAIPRLIKEEEGCIEYE